MSVRVRFAPSNTGHLHLGGARTTLFNWLFARHHGGDFLIRVEDTDAARSEQKYTDTIIEAHDWLGMTPDEDLVFQSDRLDLYREKAEELLESGAAYRDYSTEKEIEEARERGFERGDKTAHTRLWRDRDDAPDDRDSVIRIKAPMEGSLTIQDHVQGEVTVDAEELDDFVIMRSDGTPTYNFCVVVDDAEMDITHVIRGKDHLNNTFRQLYVYDALDYDPPEFGHLPLISGLSKREGSPSVQAYRDDGFLAEAIVNYLVRLGWSHGDREIFSREELIDLFELDDVNPSSGSFDEDKLRWVNSEWMKRLSPEQLAERWIPHLEEAGYTGLDPDDRVQMITEAMHKRAETLVEMTEQAGYFFTDDLERDSDAVDEWLDDEALEHLGAVRDRLDGLDDWTTDAIEDVVRGYCDDADIGLGAVAQPTRVALTGGTVSPGLFETVAMMGRGKTLRRLNDVLA